MAKHKHAKSGRPTKGEGPKLSNPEEVERLLVEGEVVPDEYGEAKRVWLTQRDVAARFGVAVSTIAAFAKDHRTTERREELRAQLDPPKAPPPPKVEGSVAVPEPSDVVRASVEHSAEPATENTAPSDERRRPGRPRHQQAPVIPFAELDRLLVFGEVSMNDDGTANTVYPTYRELAEKYGVVYRRTRLFPRMSVLPARIAILGQDESWGRDFCLAVFRANFQHDREIQSEDVVRELLFDLSLDADGLIARAKSEGVKETLRRQVDRARNLGIFGAPTFFVDGEMFWGNDRLEDALDWTRRASPATAWAPAARAI